MFLLYTTGSIYSLNLAGQRMIVLNDFMTAADFLGTFIPFVYPHFVCL